MTDRFDLEQKILQCFNILEDLRLLNNTLCSEDLSSIINYWDLKFENLWETFEEYVHDSKK